jgi:hypothetical protein
LIVDDLLPIKTKKAALKKQLFLKIDKYFYLCVFSEETVNLFLPLDLRAAKTLRPFAELILSRNPCLFLRLRCDGWNVRFIFVFYLIIKNSKLRAQI